MEILNYGVGSWKVDGHGNHRAVLKVDKGTPLTVAIIPWRRHDENPQEKMILVENEQGERVPVQSIFIGKEYGKIAFEAKESGFYYVYYLPYNQPRDFFVPKTPYFRAGYNDHLKPITGSGENPILLKDERPVFEEVLVPEPVLIDEKDFDKYPKALVVGIEARSEFDSMYPMEIPVTKDEYSSLIKGENHYMVFVEDRINQIKMRDTVPYKWYESGEVLDFEGIAQPNEIWTFQVGVLALKDIEDLKLEFEDMGNIPASDFHCINMGGKDYLGRPFTKTINVRKGEVQPLWVYVQIPQSPNPSYNGKIKVFGKNIPEKLINLTINIQGEFLEDKGVSDLWRMSRLSWLDSSLAIDDTIIPPYTSVKVTDNKAFILNREIEFNSIGFPCKIKSHGRDILAKPITFISSNDPLPWECKDKKVIVANEGAYETLWTLENDRFILKVNPRLEFDGYLNYKMTLCAKCDTVADATLKVPICSDVAQYFMGLAQRGGFAPESVEWKWNSEDAAHMAWVGTYNAGLQLRLNTKSDNYYVAPPIPKEDYPQGWWNEDKGHFKAYKESNQFILEAKSGEMTLKTGETCDFDFRLLITPFKDLDNKHHYEDRIGLPGQPRTNIVHIHHATGDVNPYINYPFLSVSKLKQIQEGLKDVPNNPTSKERMASLDPTFEGNLLGRFAPKDEWFKGEGTTDYKINLYYTCREMSNHCYEIWALRSLGDEIYSKSGIIYDATGAAVLKDGSGGGHPWVYEHCKSDYVPAWYCNLGEDHCQAISTKYISRWMNYYVNGMDYIMKKTGIDGLYLDGIGYNRETMKRIAKVMAKNSKDYRINYHSGNNYDYENWKSNVLNNTQEHLPYMTTLWIGEMFDYDLPSDYWFTEISGIPFGVYSEMLNYETGGNKYRGMLYSMTGRQNDSYMPMLKFWDDYKLEETEIKGYWEDNPVVKTNKEHIYATAYKGKGYAIISVASWAESEEIVALDIDFGALGLCENYVQILKPKIDCFQEEDLNVDIKSLKIKPAEGVILVILNYQCGTGD